MIKVLCFDWKEPPNQVIDRMALAINKSDAVLEARHVDSGGDEYIVVIGNRPLSQVQAERAYEEWLEQEYAD